MLAWLVLTTPNASAGVVINEILADPGSVVDANCDGIADSTDDEFVEIVNVGPGSFDLSNATLEDANGEVFTFPAGTVVDELDAVVVFSNGTAVLDGSASGVAPWCVNVTNRATIFVAGGSLSMNNSGDTVIVRDAGGTILDEYAYGTAANDDQSIVRNLELIGTDFVKHSTVGTGELASPGSMADITRFQIPDGKTTIPGGDCDSASEASGLVINEFLTNAPGTDDGFEWVELYNGSGGTVDLSGWAIASGTSSFSAGDPFPGGTTLPAGGYLVIAQSAKVSGGDVVNAGWSLGNATSSSDGVRLEDCNGSVADTVIYGEPNDDEFIDDGGSIATSLAPSPSEGATAARLPDGVDTDRSGSDFGELALPTPGLPNDAEVDSPCGGPLTGVVVNEFAPNPEGADEGFEWVELYHAGSDPIDLTGWKIQTATSSWSTYHEFKSGSLSPGEFLLVGGSMVGADVITDKSIGNGSSNTDGVRVVDCAGYPVDTALYGSPNEDELTDDLGDIATRTAATPGEGSSLQRVSDGYDTNDSQADFAETYAPSPGASNPEVEPVVCEPSEGSITINEFMPDPDGSDEGLEWIELYNASGSPVSVAGWGVAAGTSDYDSIDITFPGGTTVPAGAYLVVGGEFVEEADLVLDFSLGNGTGTDGLQLVDCDGGVVDTVVYGDEGNEDGMTDDNGEVGEPYGDPGSNESLARTSDGKDSDSADDWVTSGLPTPGQSNNREGSGSTGGTSSGGGCGKKNDTSAPGDGEAPETRDPNEGGCTTVPAPMGGLELLALLVAGLRRRKR